MDYLRRYRTPRVVSVKKNRNKVGVRKYLERRLRMEALESRQMLSITINEFIDERDLNITDGDISLRDAILLAPAGGTIDFNTTIMNGATINLLPELGEIVLARSSSGIGGADFVRDF